MKLFIGIVCFLALAVCALLLLPLSAYIKFDGDFYVKLKIGGIGAFEIEPGQDEPKKKKPRDTESDKTAEKQGIGLFERIKRKKGFAGAVREILTFVGAVLTRIKKQLPHIAVRRLCLTIVAAGSDAAQTAIEYGGICCVAYPILSLVDSAANVQMKQINITADFTAAQPKFNFSVIIRIRVITLLSILFGVLREYMKLKKRNEV